MAFWEGERWGTYLGKNKEVFDGEVFAILRAVRALEERGQEGRVCTVFSDSQAAIVRVQHDRCGLAQALAKAAIAITDDLCGRDKTLTIRWTPSHEGVAGNEQADAMAKRAAEGREENAEPEYLRLSHLNRKAAEMRTEATAQWIRARVGRRHRYRPPPGDKMRKGLARVRKELAGRFYQLLSGMLRLPSTSGGSAGPVPLCASGAGVDNRRDSTFSLSAEGGVRKSGGYGRGLRGPASGAGLGPPIRTLFGDTRATAEVLEFLEDARVGRMPGQTMLAGGPDVEEEDMEEIELWDPGEEEGISESEEDGPGPPL